MSKFKATGENREPTPAAAGIARNVPWLRPPFVGMGYAAIDHGHLSALERIINERSSLRPEYQEEYRDLLDTFERIRDAWAEVEAMYGDGAMLNLDCPYVKRSFGPNPVVPGDPEQASRARKMRSEMDATWLKSAYEVAAYAPDIRLPPRHSRNGHY